MSDDEVIEELTQVKGIGRWTVQMLLIFSMGRPDVLPVDDFGIRTAIQRLYELAELPRRAEIATIAAPGARMRVSPVGTYGAAWIIADHCLQLYSSRSA